MSDESQLRDINQKLTEHGEILRELLTSLKFISEKISRHETDTESKFKAVSDKLDRGNDRFLGIDMKINGLERSIELVKLDVKKRNDTITMIKRPMIAGLVGGFFVLTVWLAGKYFGE